MLDKIFLRHYLMILRESKYVDKEIHPRKLVASMIKYPKTVNTKRPIHVSIQYLMKTQEISNM